MKTHRQKVGGMWEVIGPLQFDFLVDQGLEPGHWFLDVGCGALRGGLHFISYLDSGHYHGIDRDPELIRAGVEIEAAAAGVDVGGSRFAVTDSFEISSWETSFDYAIAQSVFTHLPDPKLAECFTNLRPWVDRFYATYWPTSTGRRFSYDPKDLQRLADGWTVDIIGDWDHPRGQQMAVFS